MSSTECDLFVRSLRFLSSPAEPFSSLVPALSSRFHLDCFIQQELQIKSVIAAGIETLVDPLVRNSALLIVSSIRLTAWTCNQAASSDSILFNLLNRICDSLGCLVSGWPWAYSAPELIISFPFRVCQPESRRRYIFVRSFFLLFSNVYSVRGFPTSPGESFFVRFCG